jgi:ribosomal protein S18 acetylase RimI-like enzyme
VNRTDAAVSVRLASLDEAPLVRSIMRQAFAEYAGALPVASGAHSESIDDVVAAMRAGGAVLAFGGDEAIGSARYKPVAGGLYVGRVAVLPVHRRRGVASAMMRFLEGVAVRLGRAAIHVEVRDSLPANVGLYQALGYELISIAPHPRGPDRVWAMRKSVSAP